MDRVGSGRVVHCTLTALTILTTLVVRWRILAGRSLVQLLTEFRIQLLVQLLVQMTRGQGLDEHVSYGF